MTVPAKRANLIWLALYLAAITATVAALTGARRWALAELERPEARAQWEKWRQDETRRAAEETGSPVRRRPPKSSEPPTLVLLRDSFPAVVAAAVVIGSVLFGFVMLTVRGMMSGSRQ